MHKPTLLVFQDTTFPVFKQVTSRYFTLLEKKYDLWLEKVDYSMSALEYVDFIIEKAKRLGKNIRGAFGLLDRETILAAMLSERLYLNGPSVLALLECQHKAKFIRHMTEIDPDFPKTYIINVEKTLDYSAFPYPCFIRPVKGGESELAFWADDQQQLQSIFQKIQGIERPRIQWYDNVFQQYFNNDYEPPEKTFILQPFITGEQYVVDGFVFKQQPYFLGYTKSVFAEDKISFISFDFPATLSPRIKIKVESLIQKLLEKVQYDNYGFNIEFIVTPEQKIFIIEVNTRISRQFIALMYRYYRISNLEMIASVATGKKPSLLQRKKTEYASSFPVRIFKDAKVIAIPSDQRIQELKKELDLVDLTIYVKPGQKMSDIYNPHSYSFRYAIVDIAGNSISEVKQHFEKVKDKLEVEFEYL